MALTASLFIDTVRHVSNGSFSSRELPWVRSATETTRTPSEEGCACRSFVGADGVVRGTRATKQSGDDVGENRMHSEHGNGVVGVREQTKVDEERMKGNKKEEANTNDSLQ